MALAGALEIQISAGIARLQSDMTQVKGVVGSSMKSVESSVAGAKAALGVLGIAAGGAWLANMTADIIKATAALDDMAEQTGATVEELSKIQTIAKIGGHEFGGITEAIGKMIKGLKGADEVGQAAGRGLEFLGISAKDANGRFRDSAVILQEVAQALSKYEDGGNKVALVQDILGKSGAKYLSLLKDLAEEGPQQAKVTAQQAAEAERLEKNWNRLKIAGEDMRRSWVTSLTPAMVDFTGEMVKAQKEGRTLWAIMTAIAKNMEIMPKGVGDWMQGRTDARRGTTIWEQAGFDPVTGRKLENAGGSGDTGMPTPALLTYQSDTGKKEAKAVAEVESAYKSMKKTLDEMLLTERERTEVNKLQIALDAMSAKKRAELTVAEVADLKVRAANVDLMKREKDAMENLAKNEEALAKMRQEGADLLAEEGNRRIAAYDASQKVIEQIQFETSLIDLSNEARETAIALRAIETAGIKKSDEAYANEAARLRDALALKQSAQAADDLRKREEEGWKSMWGTVESTGRNVWQIMTAGGEGMAKSVGKAIKASIIDLLYQMTAKKWLFQIGAGVTSSLGMATADAATTQAAGSFLGSNASSLVSGAAKLFGFGGGAALSGTALAGEAAALGVGSLYGGAAAGAASTGIMAGLASIGPVGWAAIAAGALLGGSALFGEKDKRKQSELMIRGLSGGMLGLEPINVNGAGNIDANNPAYAAAAALLNQLPDAIRAGLIGTSVGTGPSDSAEGMIQALFNLPEIQAATKAAEELAVATKAVEVADLAAAEAARALADERRNFEIRLMEATGDALGALAAKRDLERAAANEANRGLLDQIYAAEDMAAAAQAAAEADRERAAVAAEAERVIAQAAADAHAREKAIAAERYGLETQYLQLIGDTAGLRARELAGLDGTNRALAERNFALIDEQTAAKAAAEALAAQAQIERQTAADAIAQATRIAGERYGIETQYLQLIGDTATLRKRELALLDESNRAMAERNHAIQDETKAIAEAEQARAQAAAAALARINTWQGLQARLQSALGNSAAALAAQRAIEINAAAQIDIALLVLIYAAEDAAAAAQTAAKAAQDSAAAQAQVDAATAQRAAERYSLDTQLLQLQGNTVELRARELAALDASNRAIQEQIYALQDQQAAAKLAAQADQAAAAAATQAADAVTAASDKLVASWQSVTDSIFAEVNRIRGLMGASPQSLAEAQAQFAIATAQARAGDLGAAQLLPGLSQSMLDMVLKTATSSTDVQRMQGQIANSLQTTASQTVGQFGLDLPGGSNAELVAEVRALRAELVGVRRATQKTADLLTRVSLDGESLQTTPV